jgi:hypothetical protein
MVEGIYFGIIIPEEVDNLIDEFLNYSKEFQKTGKDKLDAIYEACKRHKIDHYNIRRIINHLWLQLGYSESHKRRLLSEQYPELVNKKFANNNTNKNGKALILSASPSQGQLPSEMTSLFHGHDTEPKPEPEPKPIISLVCESTNTSNQQYTNEKGESTTEYERPLKELEEEEREIQDIPYTIHGVISYQDFLTIQENLNGKTFSTFLREFCHSEAERIRKLKELR